jgi:hypothetical protein
VEVWQWLHNAILLEIAEPELSKVVHSFKNKNWQDFTLFIKAMCALHVKATSRTAQCIN